MEDKVKILSHNLKFLRKSIKLNQEELAKKLNIKRSNIAAYEAKNVEPRLKTILEMARLFDIDLSHFLQVKLVEGDDFPAFDGKTKDIEKIIPVSINNADVTNFIEKSVKIKKILVGFKAFYEYRKSRLIDKTPDSEKLIYDIDNFIQLIEHMLSYNEVMIKASTNHQRLTNH